MGVFEGPVELWICSAKSGVGNPLEGAPVTFTQHLGMWDEGGEVLGKPKPIIPYYYLYMAPGETEA